MTGKELAETRDRLEREAAASLGFMLFEFSRLDMSLGLCLAWTDDGTRLDEMSEKVDEMSLHDKLHELSKHVHGKLVSGSEAQIAYVAWLDRAHHMRKHRNALVHGRWGVEAHKGTVVNVRGSPNSASQMARNYTIEELAWVNEELRQLQMELGKLRSQWPL